MATGRMDVKIHCNKETRLNCPIAQTSGLPCDCGRRRIGTPERVHVQTTKTGWRREADKIPVMNYSTDTVPLTLHEELLLNCNIEPEKTPSAEPVDAWHLHFHLLQALRNA
jgi:hypothetical protein